MPYAFDLNKIRPPRGAEFYPRTRLVRWLDQACSASPVIWVCGPAGSGKTALINNYLAHRNKTAINHNLTLSDEGLVKLQAALRRHLQVGIHPEGEPSQRPDTREDTTNSGVCAADAANVLVFDDCEGIPDDHETFGFLSNYFEKLPADQTIIFISRCGPPAAFARWTFNQRIAVLSWDELRLTPEESLGIARLRGYKSHGNSTLMQVHERAAGWLGGLLLILQEMTHERQKQALLPRAGERNIHDYLRSEVFSNYDTHTQYFLMASALLQGMSTQLVEQLTNDPATQDLLEELCHRNCFTERHVTHDIHYQFHPLFREFLLAEAATRLSTDKLAEMRQRAAQLLEGNNQIESAAIQLIQARDWVELLGLISRHAAGLLRQGRAQTVESWLHALPVAIISTTPWALYWMGTCHLTHCDRSGCADFFRAYSLFLDAGNSEGILLSWSGAVDTLLATHQYHALDQWIDVMDEYLAANKDYPSKDCEHRVTTSMFSALLYRQPGRCDFETWQERVKTCLHQAVDDAQIITMTRRLLQHQIWFGNAGACAVIVNTAAILSSRPDQRPDILIQCGLIESAYLWFTASFGECLETARRTLELAQEFGMHRWDNELLGYGVCASIGLTNLSEARDWLQKMSMTLYIRPHYETAQYHFLSAWYEMERGGTESAFEHADTARRIFSTSGAILEQALSIAGLAHISYERGEPNSSAQYLDEAIGIATSTGSAHLQFLCHVIQYAIDGDDGTRDQSRVHLMDAFSLGSRNDYQNTFWWHRNMVAQASAAALSHGIEINYVQSIVRRHELTLENQQCTVENWPWLLKIYTLGRFSLLKHGQPLLAARKAQHKPLEMLKVLIAFGGREVSVDLLASVLWPDAEGDAGKNSFDITLHRLRKLIGTDKALVLKDGRLTIDSRYCWVDTWSLERMIGHVDMALRSDRHDNEQIMRLSSEILALYQGHYLGKEYSQPWSLNLRERLRSKYLRHVTDMAHYLEKNQRWEDAIVYYQKGLEVDDLAEQFYQSFMICYQQLGRRSEALAVYRRCRSALSIILGIEPSSVTESIRKSLLS